MALVAVQDRDAHPLHIGQGLVAFQARVEGVNAVPERLGIQQRMDASHGVGAAGGLVHPVLPKAGSRDQGPGGEAAQAGPEHTQGRCDHGCGGDTGFQSPIRERRHAVPGDVKNLFRVSDQAAETGERFLSRSRFHSDSDTASINSCIRRYSVTASRTRSCHACGTQIWRSFPP